VHAIVALCTGAYHLSKRTTQDVMAGLFGVQLSLRCSKAAFLPLLTRALTGGSRTRTRVPAEALRTCGAPKTPGARVSGRCVSVR